MILYRLEIKLESDRLNSQVKGKPVVKMGQTINHDQETFSQLVTSSNGKLGHTN